MKTGKKDAKTKNDEKKKLGAIRDHYLKDRNVRERIKLATTGFSGKLITHNFKRIVNLLAPYENKEKVIDIGCGFGYLLHFLPEKVDAYGFDLSKTSLKYAKKFRKKFKPIIGDAHNTKLKDNTFDKLFCICVTAHLLDVEKALKEFYRILKPGGQAVITFTNKFSPINIPLTIFGIQYGIYFTKKIQTPSPQHSFSYFRAKKILEKTGFRILKSLGWGMYFPYELGKKIPWVAHKWTDLTIRIQDNFLAKPLSTQFIFKLQKPEPRTKKTKPPSKTPTKKQ